MARNGVKLRVQLPLDSVEAGYILRRLRDTIGKQIVVHSLERFHNEHQVRQYKALRTEIARRNNNNPNERLMFHGSKAYGRFVALILLFFLHFLFVFAHRLYVV